jgi:predicted HD superfamily hydrolase involved in NAD metabolism
MKKIVEIQNKLKTNLTEDRFQHTLAVTYTATSMAMKYNVSLEEALYAGLLHDCAKCIPNEQKYLMASEYGLQLNEVEKINPALLHARLGRYVAKNDYGIGNEQILQAIERHTTGAPGMSILDKIIFLADYIEPTREESKYLKDVRDLAFVDLDKCLIRALEYNLDYLKKSGKAIDETTIKTYEYYQKKKNAL